MTQELGRKVKNMLKKTKIRIWVAVCLCAVLSCSLSGCAEKKQKQEKNEDNTQKELVSLEDTKSNLGHWARAMGAVLIYMNEGHVYYFGGYEKTEGNQSAAVNILKDSWNITDRSSLITTINDLLQTGDRTEYRKEAKEINEMSAKKLRTAMKQLSGDMKTHYEMVQYNWEKWGSTGLLAWDMCRISHLAQWGYVANYLSLEEAQAVIEPAAAKLKSRFSSWDDVQMNWMDGYALHASIDATESEDNDYVTRVGAYATLKENDSAISEQRECLFDDNLFQQDIVPLSSATADSVLGTQKK